MTDGPGELRLARHREVGWVLVPAFSIAAFGGAAWVWSAVAGDGADWSVAGPGLALLAGVAFGLWVLLSLWLRANERRHAAAVVSTARAVWPQYATRAQWERHVDAVVEQGRFDPLQVVGPAAAFSAAAVLIAVVTAITGDAGPALAIGGAALVVIWVLAGGTIAARRLASRRRQRRVRVRLSAIEPVPRCWVAEEGAYFEDTGLVRFDRLAAVAVVEPDEIPAHRKALTASGQHTGMATDLSPLDTRLAKSGWSLLAVTSDSTMVHTFWRRIERALQSPRHRRDWIDTVHVRVPPDQRHEAHELAARIRRRWLS